MDRQGLLSAIAPCGIDCINCPVQENNVTPEIQTRIATAIGCSPEKMTCKGCRSDKRAPICPADCATLTCSRDRGVDFCHECAEFPCTKFNPASDRADKLPHNLKVYNLCRMKNIGPEKWLEEEAKNGTARYYRGKMVIGKGPQIKE